MTPTLLQIRWAYEASKGGIQCRVYARTENGTTWRQVGSLSFTLSEWEVARLALSSSEKIQLLHDDQ